MVGARAFSLATFAACLLAATPALAAPADTTGTQYALITPPSAYEVGCQGPCACPILSRPTYGSFQLVETGVDPLYTHYAVERYIASFNNGPGAVSIVGSGQYKVGGEVALMQELTLDLSIEGNPPVHFDSGLQPVSVPFPEIDVSAAVHGFYCFDTVIVVRAKPTYAAGTPGPSTRIGLQAVRPNPFRGQTTFAFMLDRPGPASLTVLDATGRRVRELAAPQLGASGPQSVTWEGRSDNGRVAPAGVYWVRLRWLGGVDSRRFIKLD